MKNWYLLILGSLLLFSSCGGINSLSKAPAEDKVFFDKSNQLAKTPNDKALQEQFTLSYANAVNRHTVGIAQYEAGNQPDKWERIMNEYAQLNKLYDAVIQVPSAAKLVKYQRYDEEYRMAKENAAASLYDRATAYLRNDNRNSAMQAYNLFKRTNQLVPGYKDVTSLMNTAKEKSILSIVINPVNYYAQSYNYWGLSNDYVQYQLTNDLRYQLGNSGNIKVYTDREAYSNQVYPDRVVDLDWNELFMPMPTQQSFSRQVSRQIQTGVNADKKPVYTTVYATLYITQKSVQARGTLTCRITDPQTNRTLLYETYPGGYNWREEYATYRGDSRALSSYDWALVNNSNFRDPTRNNLFNEVLRQVYPRLINSIKSVTWYS